MDISRTNIYLADNHWYIVAQSMKEAIEIYEEYRKESFDKEPIIIEKVNTEYQALKGEYATLNIQYLNEQ